MPIHFPELTPKQAADNKKASGDLIVDKYYKFDPPVEATGLSTKLFRICPPGLMEFDRGKYLGFKKGQHVFVGKPVDDPRKIPGVDRADKNSDLRNCYFGIDFIGGSSVEIDPDQNP